MVLEMLNILLLLVAVQAEMVLPLDMKVAVAARAVFLQAH